MSFSRWTMNFVEFVGECLIKNYEERPLAIEVAEHPFLQCVPKNPTFIKRSLIDRFEPHPLSKTTNYEATVRGGKLKVARRVKCEQMDKVFSIFVFLFPNMH